MDRTRPPASLGTVPPAHEVQTVNHSSESPLVIVANRLPVQAPARGRGPWTRSPGGLADGAAPHARRIAAACGSAGRAGGSTVGMPEGPRIRRCNRSRSTPETLRGYYDGFSNSTLWPLYHDADRPARVSPGLVARLRQCGTHASPRRSPRLRRRAPQCGCTTTTCSSSPRCSASAGRIFASASSSTSRFLPPDLFMRFRGAARCSKGSPVPTSSASRPRVDADNFRERRAAVRRPEPDATSRSCDERQARRRVPDLGRLRALGRARSPGAWRSAVPSCASSSATRVRAAGRRSPRLHEGHRATTSRVPRTARRRPARGARRRVGPGRRAQPRSRQRLSQRAGPHRAARRARSTATSRQVGTPAVHYIHRRSNRTRSRRSTRPPT